jgi:hypothetical protein
LHSDVICPGGEGREGGRGGGRGERERERPGAPFPKARNVAPAVS